MPSRLLRRCIVSRKCMRCLRMVGKTQDAIGEHNPYHCQHSGLVSVFEGQLSVIDNSRHPKPGGFFPLSLLDHNTPADRSKGFHPAFPSLPRHRRQRALQPCDRHATRRPRSSSTRRWPHSKTHSQPFAELSSKHTTHAPGFHPPRTHHSQQNPILCIHTFSTGLPVGDLESRITSFHSIQPSPTSTPSTRTTGSP